ncbi:hypothetical protein EMIT0196MI5_70085 [Pseudomonas sp. IT-196MI5]
MREKVPWVYRSFSSLARAAYMDSPTLLFGFCVAPLNIFLDVQVTLTMGARLKSQHPAMFRLSTRSDLRSSHSCVIRSSTCQPA